MVKSDIQKLPQYFDRYIALVPDLSLIECFDQFGSKLFSKESDQLNALDNKIYAPGKWTIKDILQHIIDTERIFAYRALRFARFDDTVLSGFNENEYAEKAFANQRSIEELLIEFDIVRKSTQVLFESFNPKCLHQNGQTFMGDISVLAIGYTVVGHGIHHLNVIKERYFPLLNP